ncbi:hypothetical protein N7449_001798 [Penicillium cf. viridicatum]|uniref:Uncharacterized protein n=1 Tax=Penicillium cf. viridicatum TaxID=2972119 RepID=A0A9W9N8S5_9EURO|nr:hypothetical protein N7449_001798 [Penicillium cf. viridicatum]
MLPDYSSLLDIPLLGLDPSQMFDSFRNFKPVRNYHRDGRRLFEYGKGLQIPSQIFATIIGFDHFLRAIKQRKERHEIKLRALEKFTEDDTNKRHDYEKHIERFKVMIPEIAEDLHNAEVLLPQRPLKKIYDEIRQDPAWYLRKELINDCMERGGCCGRTCGCCEKRCLAGVEKGIGHCTVACWCCEVNSGYSMTDDDWRVLVQNLLDRLRSENPSYLLAMTEAYFSKPGIFGLGKMSMARSLAWYWKKGSLWQWKRVSK